jgi:hypothetical protein
VTEAKSDTQVVYLIGASRGAKDGDRRTVDSATAERLVSENLARLPKSKSK